ncbi:MAG: AAA family ATPase [Clostridia bacterium]|nr:AAA family ATPase [Clostridia bacterium]
MNRIIAVVGMCGSGKSELTKYFLEDGFDSVHLGDVTMKELKKRGLPVCEQNERAIREEVRATYGLGAYAILLYPEIEEKAEKKPLVLDGLYSWSEYLYLKEKLGDRLSVWAIVTDASIRRERLAKRPVRPLTAEEVDRRDKSEIENLEKGGPIAAADKYLINNGTPAELRAQYERLMGR